MGAGQIDLLHVAVFVQIRIPHRREVIEIHVAVAIAFQLLHRLAHCSFSISMLANWPPHACTKLANFFREASGLLM